MFPNPGTSHQIADPLSEALHKLYPRVSGFRFNYVISPNNSSVESDLISIPLDRIILKFIRSQSDLIITTGLTARSEVLKGSSYAPMLILTKTDASIDVPALTKESQRNVYVTQKLETSYQNSQAMAIGKVQQPLTDFCLFFSKLNDFGSVVLESGLTVAAEFAQAGLLAEIDITVTGVQAKLDAEEIAKALLARLKLETLQQTQLLQFENNWFFRFSSPKATD